MRNPLHAICPYFAMFPEGFVETWVNRLTNENEFVLDPFSGRGTTLLQSLLMGRNAIATDVNPVAYCISAAKGDTPNLDSLKAEIARLAAAYGRAKRESLDALVERLPPFFRRAFHRETLRQLLYLRSALDWRDNRTQRFVAALILGMLHGEMDRSERYLSNQMPRTISPKPNYSLKYWRDHGLWPRRRDVFERLAEDAELRLRTPPPRTARVAMTDARRAGAKLRSLKGKVAAVVTSPPYYNVTNFEEDQWLRLWFLGFAPRPTYRMISLDDRHENEAQYWKFLGEVWRGLAPLLKRDATLVCRLGGTGLTQTEITRGLLESVRTVFPNMELARRPEKSEMRRRQTPIFRPGSVGCRFEVDYVIALGQPSPG